MNIKTHNMKTNYIRKSSKNNTKNDVKLLDAVWDLYDRDTIDVYELFPGRHPLPEKYRSIGGLFEVTRNPYILRQTPLYDRVLREGGFVIVTGLTYASAKLVHDFVQIRGINMKTAVLSDNQFVKSLYSDKKGIIYEAQLILLHWDLDINDYRAQVIDIM